MLKHPNVICSPRMISTGHQDFRSQAWSEIATQFVDIFEGRRVNGVINCRILSQLNVSKELQPWVDLAERLGSLQSQLLGSNLHSIQVCLRGPRVRDTTGILSSAALKGALSSMATGVINYVNAPLLAREFGLNVSEVVEGTKGRFPNSLSVIFHTDTGSHELVGTVNNNWPRVVQVNDYAIELSAQGHTCWFTNLDKPGVIAAICAQLASNGLNVASFSLGRAEAGGTAIGVLEVDSPVPEEVLFQLTSIPNVMSAQTTSLPRVDSGSDVLRLSGKPAARPRITKFATPIKKSAHVALKQFLQGKPREQGLVGPASVMEVLADTKRLLQIPPTYQLFLTVSHFCTLALSTIHMLPRSGSQRARLSICLHVRDPVAQN